MDGLEVRIFEWKKEQEEYPSSRETRETEQERAAPTERHSEIQFAPQIEGEKSLFESMQRSGDSHRTPTYMSHLNCEMQTLKRL